MASIQSTPSKSESTGPPTTTESTTQSPTTSGNSAYPEQHHAGQVGYGPNYQAGPSLEDRMEGLKEEIKGKLTRNPDRVQHGREIYTGEQKRKDLTGEGEPNVFATAQDDKSEDPNKVKDKGKHEKEGQSVQLPSGSTSSPSENPTQSQSHSETNLNAKATPTGMAVDQGHGPDRKKQAATVAPEGTHKGNVQADDNVKHIDVRN